MQVGNINSGGNTTLKEAQGDIVETTNTHINIDIGQIEQILSESSLNDEQRHEFRNVMQEIVVSKETGNQEKLQTAIKSLFEVGFDEASRWIAGLFC